MQVSRYVPTAAKLALGLALDPVTHAQTSAANGGCNKANLAEAGGGNGGASNQLAASAGHPCP